MRHFEEAQGSTPWAFFAPGVAAFRSLDTVWHEAAPNRGEFRFHDGATRSDAAMCLAQGKRIFSKAPFVG